MAERTLFLEKLKEAACKKKEDENQHDFTINEQGNLPVIFMYAVCLYFI